MPRTLVAAFRSLTRPGGRGHATAALLTLSLGIGATVAIYGLLHAVLLAPLALPDEARVMRVAEAHHARQVEGFAVATGTFLAWQQRVPAFAAIVALAEGGATVTEATGAERVSSRRFSPGLWNVTGHAPLLGRGAGEADTDLRDAVMIGEAYWQARYGRDAGVLGRSLHIDGVPRRIVGVVPDELGIGMQADVWLPLDAAADAANYGDRRLTVLARLAPGASRAQAEAQLHAVTRDLAQRFPDSNGGWSAQLQPLRDWLVPGDQHRRLWLLLVAVGLLLLMTCANLASLQLARLAQRQRELGVRQALGADAARMRAELLTETLALLGPGSVAGVALAAMTLQLLRTRFAPLLPSAIELALSPAAATIAIAACAATVLLFAAVPATLAARQDPARVLGSARRALGAERTPLRHALVIAQFASATVLICLAGVLGARLQQLAQADLGFSPASVLTARLALPPIRDQDEHAAQQASIDRLLAELGAAPGVESIGIASEAPLGDLDTQMELGPGPMPLEPEGAPDQLQASWRIVGGDYFDAIGVALLRGRGFRADEPGDSVILGRSVAQRVFGSEDAAVGRVITLGNHNRKRVVGVVADTRQRGLDQPPTPTMYFPTSWYLWESMTVVLRSGVDPAALMPQLRERAARALPQHPLYDLAPLDARVSAAMAAPRLQAFVVLAFALAGALIAAIGVGGIARWWLARRRGEFALRIALGASPAQVGSGMLAMGGRLAATGIGIGCVAVLATCVPAATLLGSTPATIALCTLPAALLLGAVALFACWGPARRALAVAPAQALMAE